ncbi:diaminobutyrate acetyltransferase [Streptomyces sp. 6N223]|uniref:diaminobutyrate acetyltransferase n=1 Tax=Streptomyces sp. 6N223 TaxID=3457412 RepID=UPI003FD5372E
MPQGVTLDSPRLEDGAALWRIARDSRVLDLNSCYSYLLWCRDYAETSIVARSGDAGAHGEPGAPVGFITGYTRPAAPSTLLVWQVAVDETHRGRGLAAAMLDALTLRARSERGVDVIETTITPDNAASRRLFTSFATRHGAAVSREVLFDAAAFPEDGHAPEVLYRIGPIAPSHPHRPSPSQ